MYENDIPMYGWLNLMYDLLISMYGNRIPMYDCGNLMYGWDLFINFWSKTAMFKNSIIHKDHLGNVVQKVGKVGKNDMLSGKVRKNSIFWVKFRRLYTLV